ncbi:hypothetical protein ALQ86_03127, partial [Pseudomonas amygdali pv. eriobotryae]
GVGANVFAKEPLHSPEVYRLNYSLRGQVRSYGSLIIKASGRRAWERTCSRKGRYIHRKFID